MKARCETDGEFRYYVSALPGLDLAYGLRMNSSVALISSFTRSTSAVLALYALARASVTVFFGTAVSVFYRGTRQDVYNMLWSVVFGFATLNILSLAARRVDSGRRGLNFGEVMAVGVVVLSAFLLGWELLNLLHIFPIRLKR